MRFISRLYAQLSMHLLPCLPRSASSTLLGSPTTIVPTLWSTHRSTMSFDRARRRWSFRCDSFPAPTVLSDWGHETLLSGILATGSSACLRAMCSPGTAERRQRMQQPQDYRSQGQLLRFSRRATLWQSLLHRRRATPTAVWSDTRQHGPAGCSSTQPLVVFGTHRE